MVSPDRRTCWWKRAECVEWLVQVLQKSHPRCLIAMDFGFGYPWGADEVVFRCQGWRKMIGAIAATYGEEGSAEATAEQFNAKIGKPGPYRFGRDRSDFHFYLDRGIAYYRLVETVVPQAMSQWFFPRGPRVASSTITGMAALDHLMTLREEGGLDFQVWPQEGFATEEDKHVIVESYPAIYPDPLDYGECTDEHCRDAWRVLQWMLGHHEKETLGDYFEIAPMPFGLTENASFEEQVRFEGWIFGVR